MVRVHKCVESSSDSDSNSDSNHHDSDSDSDSNHHDSDSDSDSTKMNYKWFRLRFRLRNRSRNRRLIPTPESESPQVWLQYSVVFACNEYMLYVPLGHSIYRVLSKHSPDMGYGKCITYNNTTSPPFSLLESRCPFHSAGFSNYTIR